MMERQDQKLEESFAALKEYFTPSRQSESSSNPAQLVLFAEHAIKYGRNGIASECIELFFSLDPPANQFIIRAHLCQALIAAPSNSSEESKLVDSLSYIVKAVSAAKKSECYNFLVYNASILLWQVSRPFQKPGHRRLLAKPLQSVVRALEEVKEKDYAWRLQLLIGLTHSQVEAGQREEASKTCSSAAQLARKRVPDRIMDILKVQALYHLGEGKTLEKEVKASPELAVIQKLYKIKSTIHQKSLNRPELEQKLRKILTFVTEGEDPSPSGRKTSQPLSTTPTPPPSSESRPPILVELAEVCLEQRFLGLASECLAAFPREVQEASLSLQKEALSCWLTVQQLGAAEESYTRSAVEVRLQAIKSMEEILTSALRLGDAETIQEVCVVQWNLCLPLLQHNLRYHLLKPLSAIARALETLSSLLHQLRCSIHFELAKICAHQNQLQTALEHLDKASSLDHHGERVEQLAHLRYRLELRVQLYQTPEDLVDRAAMVVEQAVSSLDGGSAEELRSVLVGAGELLAPNCFIHSVGRPSDQENSSRKLAGVPKAPKGGVFLEDLGRKLRDYELGKTQVEEHAKSVDPSTEKERCMLWADLAKLARKQNIWDVALAAAKFCLLYDDGRWTIVETKADPKSDLRLHEKQSFHVLRGASPSASQLDKRTGTSLSKPLPEYQEVSRSRTVRDLLRSLAEIHCLHAECLVYQLQQDGLSLGDKPTGPPPATDTEQAEQWKMYCDWSSQVSADAHKSFLRAAELGCMLKEPWLVSNAAAYLWNYSHQCLEQGRLSELVEVFRPLLASIKQAQLQHEGPLICRVCTVLAGGLVQKWMPKPADSLASGAKGAGNDKKKGGGRADSRSTKKKGSGDGGQLQAVPEAGPELKEALEACEYGMSVSAGVLVSVRGGLLAVWVQCKQLLQQPIPEKTFGIEDSAKDSHVQQCRVVVAVEMVSKVGGGLWDFPSCPSLQEVCSLLEGCQWSERVMELELWTRTASIAFSQQEFERAGECAKKALQIGDLKAEKDPQKKSKKKDSSSVRLEQELLSLASSLLGQSLVSTAAGNTATSRRALDAFLSSARYGHQARSYHCVVEACRHYWSTCQPLVNSALERELLQQPLSELLGFLASFGRKRKDQNNTGGGGGGGGGGGVSSEVTAGAATREDPRGGERDLMLQVAMYGVVFQAYTDKCQWQQGLKAAEDAMWVTPKAMHRHLAQYKLVFKSKMGKNVEGDMIRFQEEPEEFVALLWYRAASNATNPKEELKAYQNAIEALKDPAHSWQKVDYLLEFGEWLYSQQFPVQDALDQLQWAADILLEAAADNRGAPESPPTPVDHMTSKTTPSAPSSSSISDVRLLEGLMRVHIMMAQLTRMGGSGHQKLCLAALSYCMALWKQTFSKFGKSEAVKPPGCRLPQMTEEWATLQLPGELKDFIRGSAETESLSKASVKQPILTLHYLNWLCRELCSMGLHPLVPPILHLQLALVECLLGNKAFTQLLHMRLASLCLALGLKSVAAAHSEKVGQAILNPEDLARSHSEMEQYRAKQAAVEKEESKRNVSSGRPPSLDKNTRKPPGPGQGWGLREKVPLREVWVEQAEVLIQQGQYQGARELLHEARTSSQVFGDERTLARAQLGLAALSVAEKNTACAINLLLETKSLPVELQVWLDGILLLSEAVLRDENCQAQAKDVLQCALGMLESLQQRNKNEAPRVDHARAILRARAAEVSIQELLHSSGGQARSEILKHCDVFSDSSQTLLRLGHESDAVQVLVQHASVLKTLGLATRSEESHKQDLLQALALYERAMRILQATYGTAKTLCQPSEGMCLPVQKELVMVQLGTVDLLAMIFAEHSAAVRKGSSTQLQKSCIEKMIDDFVRESPQLSLVEQDWQDTARSATDKMLGILSSAHAMSTNDLELKAKCAYGLGRCLHLLSQATSPDSSLQWHSPGGSEGEAGPLGGGRHYSTLSTVMRREEASQAELDEASSLHYLSQACQSLAEAVALALQNGNREVATKASMEIMECCGYFDPPTSSLYLALYQSCVVSEELYDLLMRAQPDPSSSQLAALLEQNSRLRQACSPSTTLSANVELLEKYECWQRLKVQENHLDLLRNFPSHFRFIVLQHSPDRSTLYGAYLIPPQPPPPAPKKGQPPPQIDSLEPVVASAAVSPAAVDSLLELVRDHHLETAHRLARTQTNWGEKAEDHSGPPSPTESQFADILAAMEVYLSDITTPIENALRQEASDKELTVVLLADSKLLQLPLEALKFLQVDNVCSVARDFSLQMFYYRITKFLPKESDPEKQKAASSKEKKRGTDKYQPQPATLLANPANIKHILDPRNDTKSTDDESPTNEILSQIQAFAKVSAKWSGHVGTDHAMSIGEWPALLQNSSGLLLFSSGRLLAHYSPANLAPLNLQECSIVILMDQMQTSTSALLQSKLDMHKSAAELELESPLQTAMLFSLVGTGSFVANQWHTTVQTNVEKMNAMIKGLVSECNTVGSLNWSGMKQPKREVSSAGVEGGDSAIPKEDSDAGPPKEDTVADKTEGEKMRGRDVEALYNCIVYGLPHVTLVPPSNA